HERAAEITYYGLHATQHRGQEGAGIVTSNGENLKLHKGTGLLNDVFKRTELDSLSGMAAIGHVHYVSIQDTGYENVQQHLFRSQTAGSMALTHSGNIMNAHDLREMIEGEEIIFHTTTDTELMAHLIKRHGRKVDKDGIM